MTVLTRLTSVALVLGLAVAPLRAEIIERVLVKVNGDIMTKTDLETRQVAALRERAQQRVDPAALKNDETLRKLLLEITPQLLVDAIDEMLMLQLGKEKGYHLTDEQFKSWLENLRKTQDLLDDQKFQAAMKSEGMTIDELRKNVERNFMITQVQREEVGSKLQITEEEARQYYLGHKEEFVEPAAVTLREIFIEIPTTTSKQGQSGITAGADDEAVRRIEAARARVAAGEDFGKVASEVSAAGSKANGGLIGPIAMDELSPSLQQRLQKMKPGDMTETLRVQKGYQILRLETFKPAASQPFENVRDLVADKVHDQRQQTEVKKFLSRVRGQAIIEWKSDELKQLYEKQVALLDKQATGDK
jgi:peptidyl-prolyl cis-trans isomerase SurA